MSDNNYVNVEISNNPDNAGAYPPNIEATYNETLSIPILGCPESFYCSINRFTIPTDQIPIFSFPVDEDQNQANQSLLQIGIENAATAQFPRYVIYDPQNDVPAPPSGVYNISDRDSLSPYYFIFSIQPMIDMINTALLGAYTDSAVGGGAPYYIYDPVEKLISLIVTQAFLTTGARIFINSYLENYLQGFAFKTKNYNVTGPYLYYHNLTTTPYGQVTPFRFRAERSSIPGWFDINRIIVSSTTLPTSSESSTSGTQGVINYNPIITDFAVSYHDINELSTLLVLEPTPQYRLIDMSTRSPINRLNFTFQWASKKGGLYTVYCSPGNAITMKIAFFKKELYLHR